MVTMVSAYTIFYNDVYRVFWYGINLIWSVWINPVAFDFDCYTYEGISLYVSWLGEFENSNV